MAGKIGEDGQATILGAGLMTLDTIVSNSQSREIGHRIGGTFGNVLAICQTLGLHGRPITRMGVDSAGDKIIRELESLGVDCTFVKRDSAARTRQITELAPSNFNERHRFTFVCPSCRQWLPQGNAMTVNSARQLSIDWAAAGLFFFDRPSPSSIFLAKKANKSGCVVMFEPYRLNESREILSAIAVSDVVKYAKEVGNSPINKLLTRGMDKPRLIIETLGAGGLRFRLRDAKGNLSNWIKQPSFQLNKPLDSAGAGDWCSAGFITKFLNGLANRRWNRRYIERALRYGQALAASSVSFLGPRGYSDYVIASDINRAALATLRRIKVPQWVAESRIDLNGAGLNQNDQSIDCRDDVCLFCLQIVSTIP